MLNDNKRDEEICLYYTAPMHPLGVVVDGKFYVTNGNDIGIDNFDENDSDENDLEEDIRDINEDEEISGDIFE